MEPSLNPEVLCALYVPDSGLVSPYELTCAVADSAAENGVDFLLNCAVTGLSRQDGHWLVKTGRDMLEARAVINCAGTGGGDDQQRAVVQTRDRHHRPVPENVRGQRSLLQGLQKNSQHRRDHHHAGHRPQAGNIRGREGRTILHRSQQHPQQDQHRQ